MINLIQRNKIVKNGKTTENTKFIFQKVTLGIMIACMPFVMSGCVNTMTKLGGGTSSVTGSAGSTNNSAKGETQTLIKCDKPLGVAALVEPQSNNGTATVTALSQLGLPSPVPMLRLMMSQSNCFQVVDRGAASKALEYERSLAKSGELESPDKVSGGQMVVADWIMTPNVITQDSNAGGKGIGALLGGLVPGLGAIAAIAGNISIKDLEAQTLLSLTSTKTGLQTAIAEGRAQKSDISFGGMGGLGGLGGLGGVGGGSYQSTDIGKLVVAAFLDSHNKLVEQLRNSGGK